jgi:pimeloyl-ACP methyl ester carboxylesterase
MVSPQEIDRLLNHRLIEERYFFPLSARLDDAVEVPTDEGPLACWRSAPAGDAPVLLHFHGNGELIHHWIDFAPEIAAMGWDLFLAEYRGYGASAGKPRLGALLGDVPSLVRAVGVPVERIVVFGRSVGSLFAVEAVERFPELAGLVLESGIADVYERLRLRVDPVEMACTEGDFREAVAARLDHQRKLAQYEGPSLFLHAEGDHLVPISHAERNHRWVGGDRKRLVRFPRGDHNSILAFNREEYLAELARFLTAAGG